MWHYKNMLAVLLLSMYLGISHGNLAIYCSGCSEPIQTLPYDVSLFTPSDQQALAKGVPFSTDAELTELLEDFTS